MTKQEFEQFVEAGHVWSVGLYTYECAREELWQVHVFGELPGSIGNRIRQTRRGGHARVWSTLDRAYRFVRDCGYTGRITIETKGSDQHD